ncbi:MAG: hypothetical protein FJ218_06685 [Ignavibacteria bacterium]|nr:hypothetical protein [Ignavibacteria bacterium]
MKRYTKYATLPPCQLNRDGVIKLFELMRGDHMPTMQEEHIEISTQLDDMRLSSDSIAEFISHPELPDTLEDLAYEMMIWNEEGKMKKFVFLSLNKDAVWLRVDGNEPIWVNGKFTQISDYLYSKKSWFVSWKKIFASLQLLVPIITFIALAFFMQRGEEIQTFATALFFGLFLADVYFFKKGKLFPNIDIDLVGKSKLLDGQTILVMLTLITFTAAVITSLMLLR